jgi:hypothetical protein
MESLSPAAARVARRRDAFQSAMGLAAAICTVKILEINEPRSVRCGLNTCKDAARALLPFLKTRLNRGTIEAFKSLPQPTRKFDRACGRVRCFHSTGLALKPLILHFKNPSLNLRRLQTA